MRYRKTYLCLCEGFQEKMYLERIAFLIRKFPDKVVTFNILIDSPHRLKKRYEEYDSAALFDYDYKDVEFRRNIEICDKLNKELKPGNRKSGRHIYHAYSSVNIDLWLILHKEDYQKSVSSNNSYIPDVRRIYNLKATANIKNKEITRRILEQITLEDVRSAIKRADRIRNTKVGMDGEIVGNSVIYENPDFSLHEFLKIVFIASGDWN